MMNYSGKDNTTSSSVQRTSSMRPVFFFFFSVTKGVQGNMKTQSFERGLKEKMSQREGGEKGAHKVALFCSYLEFLF